MGNSDSEHFAIPIIFSVRIFMKPSRFKFPLTFALFLAVSTLAYPHAGHDKAPGDDAAGPTTGPIAITAEAKINLALQVEEAELRTLDKTVLVLGQIEAIPSRTGAVTSRIAGRVADIKVSLGDSVKKGQVVVEVESLQPGDPPPRASYTAPIDGVIIHPDIVQGDAVESNKHMLEVVDLSEVYAEGRIFEGQIAAVKTGQKVRISVESYPQETFTGTVDLLSGELDAETRTLKVWVRIKNEALKLRPNMRAELNIVTGEAESIIAVPQSAVLGEAGNFFAYVQSDTDELVFERRALVLGMKDDRYVEISEGIFPSDKVVTLGNYQLQYVTTRKAPAKLAVPAANAKPAAEEPHEHPATSTNAMATPLIAMGITLSALLALNAVLLIFKKRPSVSSL